MSLNGPDSYSGTKQPSHSMAMVSSCTHLQLKPNQRAVAQRSVPQIRRTVESRNLQQNKQKHNRTHTQLDIIIFHVFMHMHNAQDELKTTTQRHRHRDGEGRGAHIRVQVCGARLAHIGARIN